MTVEDNEALRLFKKLSENDKRKIIDVLKGLIDFYELPPVQSGRDE